MPAEPEFNMQRYLMLSGQQPAKIVESGTVEAQRDQNRFTNPDLHRRVDPQPVQHPEVLPRSYEFSIRNKHSYRVVHIYTHDEDSIESEVP